jgi:PTH1 family peptidyl-tRNA hydrolase
MTTFLVVGLGNPGTEYISTRHNIGFLVAERIADRFGIKFRIAPSNALIADMHDVDRRILIVKPQTFMNSSGRTVKMLRDCFDVPVDRILIVHDDMDVPFGEVRLKEAGGSAGHKGLQSVIDELGTEDFKRLRLGIGRPPGKKDPSDFVLEPFKSGEKKELDFVIEEATEIAVKVAENLQ